MQTCNQLLQEHMCRSKAADTHHSIAFSREELLGDRGDHYMEHVNKSLFTVYLSNSLKRHTVTACVLLPQRCQPTLLTHTKKSSQEVDSEEGAELFI